MSDAIYNWKTILDPTDVDENNHVTNQAILRILQKVSSLHCSSFGYGVSNIDTTNLAWIILNWKVEIFFRATCETQILVKTWCNPIQKLYFYREFEIYDNNNNLLAIATSKWILFDIKTNSICHNFENIKKVHPFFTKSVFEQKIVENLEEPKEIISSTDYRVQRRDIDTNHHVNNLHYLDYAYEALPENIYNTFDFKKFEIMYKHEAKLGDLLNLSYSYTSDNKHVVCVKSDNLLHAIIYLYN